MNKVEEFRARMAAKSQRARYFAELDAAATQSQIEARSRPRKPAATKAPRTPERPPGGRSPAPAGALTTRGTPRVRTLPSGADAPRPCSAGCGRLVRPLHTSIEDFPGTLRQHAAGYCATCYRNGRTR